MKKIMHIWRTGYWEKWPDGKKFKFMDKHGLYPHHFCFTAVYVLAYQHLIKIDDRTLGELFYACCEEVADILFVESLNRIMILACNRLKTVSSNCEKTATAFFDTIMKTACNVPVVRKTKVSQFFLNLKVD